MRIVGDASRAMRAWHHGRDCNVPQSLTCNHHLHHLLSIRDPLARLAAPHADMSDEEDDYLSDKFLVEAAAAASSSSSAPKTYAERRKEAQKRAALKNEQNRTKSRRELEREAREEALSRSLFERAQEEARESGRENKALAMMMKMGFKPGQALGKTEEEEVKVKATVVEKAGERGGAGEVVDDKKEAAEESKPALRARADEDDWDAGPSRAGIGARPKETASEAEEHKPVETGHRKVPLAINEWEGTSSSLQLTPHRLNAFPDFDCLPSRQEGHRAAETRRVAQRAGAACEDGEDGGGSRARLLP